MLQLRKILLLLGLASSVFMRSAAAQAPAPLHVVSTGGGSSVVVVLHGGPGFRHNYLRPEWDRLATGATVVYYDQRGCGRSTREGPFGWRQHVADLQNLLNALAPDRRIILAGSSWGAMLAVFFAHANPTRVEALILSGVPSWDIVVEPRRAEYARLPPDQRASRQAQATQVRFAPGLHVVRDSAWLVNNSGAPPNDQLVARLGDFCMLPSEVTLSSLFDAPGLAELKSVEVPTLIALGGRPDRRGSGAEALASVLPRAKLLQLQHAGHDPWLEEPAAFFAAVQRFLDQGGRDQ